jgi:hypothetical protein
MDMEGMGRDGGEILGPSPGLAVSPDRSRKAGRFVASTAVRADIVDAIANEMAVGIERAVECWMSQVEEALTDIHLTSLGRLNAVREIVDQYKHLTGKAQLEHRRIC